MIHGFREEMDAPVAHEEIGPAGMSASEAQFGAPVAVFIAIVAADRIPGAGVIVDRDDGAG